MTIKAVVGVVVLVAILTWVGLGAFSSDEDGSEMPAEAKPKLTVSEGKELASAALDDERVKLLIGNRETSVEQTIPWLSSDGDALMGARIEIGLKPELKMNKVSLPALITPGPSAPAGTKTLRRRASYSATRVSKLQVRIERDPERVVEIVPAGRAVEVTEVRLLGPSPGKAYVKSEGS